MAKPNTWEKWVVGKSFVGLEYKLIDSEMWARISNATKVLYIEVARKWDKKNGNACPYYIPFGYKDAKHLMSKPTYMAARKELLREGLLIEVELPNNNRKGIYSLNRVWDSKSDALYS